VLERREVALELGADRRVLGRERRELREIFRALAEAVPTRQAGANEVETLDSDESVVAVGPEVGPGGLRL